MAVWLRETSGHGLPRIVCKASTCKLHVITEDVIASFVVTCSLRVEHVCL